MFKGCCNFRPADYSWSVSEDQRGVVQPRVVRWRRAMASIIAARAMQKRREEKAEERAGSIKAAKAATAAEMKERAAQAMLSFDANKDGVLSKDEIGALVASMAEAAGSTTLSEEALESVILHCTGARDGTVPEMECAGLIKTAEQRGQSAAMVVPQLAPGR